MHYPGIGGVELSPASYSLLILLIVWSLMWKGFALWHAAKRDEKWWFAIFLIINTVGILELVYLLRVAKVPAFRNKVGLK